MTRSLHTGRYARFRELMIETREKCGLTQAELAARVGRPQSFVSKYEHGDRRLDVIEFVEVVEAMGADPVAVLKKVLKAGESKA